MIDLCQRWPRQGDHWRVTEYYTTFRMCVLPLYNRSTPDVDTQFDYRSLNNNHEERALQLEPRANGAVGPSPRWDSRVHVRLS